MKEIRSHYPLPPSSNIGDSEIKPHFPESEVTTLMEMIKNHYLTDQTNREIVGFLEEKPFTAEWRGKDNSSSLVIIGATAFIGEFSETHLLACFGYTITDRGSYQLDQEDVKIISVGRCTFRLTTKLLRKLKFPARELDNNFGIKRLNAVLEELTAGRLVIEPVSVDQEKGYIRSDSGKMVPLFAVARKQ